MTIKELLSINNQLHAVLDQVTKSNREESIQLINALLIDREVVLKQLDKNTVKGDPLVKQMLLDENAIRTKMELLFNDIKKDLKEVSKKRASGGNYINPYKSLRINGAFIDKKK